MAVARVCDRCGKTVTKYFYSIHSKKCLFVKDKEYLKCSDENFYEICSECMDKFKKFVCPDKKE